MKKPVAILDQFVYKGRTITYMTTFIGSYNDGRLPQSHAVFKIYSKLKPTFLQRLFKKDIKWWSEQHIANQVHP